MTTRNSTLTGRPGCPLPDGPAFNLVLVGYRPILASHGPVPHTARGRAGRSLPVSGSQHGGNRSGLQSLSAATTIERPARPPRVRRRTGSPRLEGGRPTRDLVQRPIVPSVP